MRKSKEPWQENFLKVPFDGDLSYTDENNFEGNIQTEPASLQF